MKSYKMIAFILIMALSLSLSAGCAKSETTIAPSTTATTIATTTQSTTMPTVPPTVPISTTTISPTTTQTTVKTHQLGNTSANLANGGMSVLRDGWIYFMNYADDMSLYKIKTDETGETKVCDDKAYYLNSYGDWIYYCNASDANRLYKIKPDGTDRTKISDQVATHVLVADDWIYFINQTDKDNKAEFRKIFRMKTDGTGEQKVNDQEISSFALKGDWIYYISTLGYKLHKIKNDGTGNAKVSDAVVTTFMILDDWIFFADQSQEKSTIWRMKIDGSEAVKISDDQVTSFNTSGDWIYYGHTKQEFMKSELKKMALDGTKATVINDDSPAGINVHGDLILYLDFDFASFNMTQTLIKSDGSGRKDYIFVPKSPLEGVKTYSMKESVKGGDLTVTVHSAYSTNIEKISIPGADEVFENVYDGALLYINMTITNNAGRELDINELIGRMEIQDATSYSTHWNLKADMTGRTRKEDIRYHLTWEDYQQSLIFKPGETKDVQIFDQIHNKDFPTLLTLFDSLGNAKASIEITPDFEDYVTGPEEALKIMERKFPDRRVDQLGLRLTFKFEGETEEKMYYSFKVKKPGSSTLEYYFVERDSGDIYTGAKDAKYPDYDAVPVKLLK